ncbi:MAG: Dabb family protein [Bacteroidales bacterium]|nr:Dabb family protein [Bacteroidales bacterium]
MVKHIVLFKLKEFESEEAKSSKLSEIKASLEGLTSKIEVLKSMEVGINANSSEMYDFSLTSEFEKMEDVEVYAKHPDHLAVAKIIREHLESRACVDYFN